MRNAPRDFNKSNNKFSKLLKECVCVFGMCDKSDGREEIEGENTHNRLSIDNVSALHEIYVIVRKNNDVYEISDVLYVAELYFSFFHFSYPFRISLFTMVIISNKSEKVNRNMSNKFFSVIFYTSGVFLLLPLTFLLFNDKINIGEIFA